MNKRLPLLFTLLALILLAVSIAYWFLQLYKPAQRPLAPAPVVAQAEPSPDAAASLFGGQPSVVAVSSYQLTGVVSAGRDSAVILVAEGSPPKAVRIGREIVPGVTVAEVHARYVMLSEGGIMKRVDLAQPTGVAAQGGGQVMMPSAPQPVATELAPGVEPQTAPGAVAAPPGMAAGAPVGRGPGPPLPDTPSVPEPQMDPGVADGTAPQPPPPNQVQMPPPTRSVNSPVGQPSQVQ